MRHHISERVRKERRIAAFLVLLLALLLAAAAWGQDITLRLGQIAFYGYEGLDVTALRAAFPVREGDEINHATWSTAKPRVVETVERVTGHAPTDIATICCDNKGGLVLYVGLSGRSYHPFAYNREPEGGARLPSEAMEMDTRLEAAVQEAVLKGKSAEDDSQGYALLDYPPARELELAVREYALHHDRLLREALAMSSAADHRQAAATFLGYAQQSKAQIFALVKAGRDPDDGVRNDAIRALGVLARSSSKIARQIPADSFVEMLNSGIWTDRNKAGSLLMVLTADRNPRLLAKIRSAALASLVEMAQWDAGHAGAARYLLGRIAGIPEEKLNDLVASGKVEVILEAVKRR